MKFKQWLEDVGHIDIKKITNAEQDQFDQLTSRMCCQTKPKKEFDPESLFLKKKINYLKKK